MKIKRFAELAKIKLNKNEQKQFEKDFNKILKYLKLLDQIDTDKVILSYSSPIQTYNIYKQDKKEKKKFYSKNLLENINVDKNNYINVKPILKHKNYIEI